MGKSKRRIIAKGKHQQIANITREEAIQEVITHINKHANISELITLFGLKAEELLEAGADYETVKSLGDII